MGGRHRRFDPEAGQLVAQPLVFRRQPSDGIRLLTRLVLDRMDRQGAGEIQLGGGDLLAHQTAACGALRIDLKVLAEVVDRLEMILHLLLQQQSGFQVGFRRIIAEIVDRLEKTGQGFRFVAFAFLINSLALFEIGVVGLDRQGAARTRIATASENKERKRREGKQGKAWTHRSWEISLNGWEIAQFWRFPRRIKLQMSLSRKTTLARARACLKIEAAAIAATARSLGQEFGAVARATEAAAAGGAKLIFTGVGKNAPIAQKLAATFNSTGVPSCFLDATQALHGDLGLCSEGDLAFLLSNSGQSEEVLRLAPMLRRFGVRLVAFTGNPGSELAEDRQICARLFYRVPREALPASKLAPTASTTAALALGDALAMVLLEARGLTRDDFAKFHPAGNLGRVLLLRVRDIMRQGERLPVAAETVTVQDAILAMTNARSGSICLVNAKTGRLTGIFTDGDVRRSALTGPGFRPTQACVKNEFETRAPKTIREDALGVDALRLFQTHKIDDLIVVDQRGHPVGLVDGQDLPKLKIV